MTPPQPLHDVADDRADGAPVVLRIAYADPPYLGQGRRHYADHPDHADFDTIDGHRRLVDRLMDEFPDGWAMSASSPSLWDILPLCPRGCRVAAWVKPFAIFKPGVNPAYAWEPVIFRGGRKRSRAEPTVRDWVSANITLKKGCTGAKPLDFCTWLFGLMGLRPVDVFVDLFPGSGSVSAAWREFSGHQAGRVRQHPPAGIDEAQASVKHSSALRSPDQDRANGGENSCGNHRKNLRSGGCAASR